jgi:hypothetical protein
MGGEAVLSRFYYEGMEGLMYLDIDTNYLAELARMLDELKSSIDSGQYDTMSATERELFLGRLRDVYALMESELSKLADEIEKEENL